MTTPETSAVPTGTVRAAGTDDLAGVLALLAHLHSSDGGQCDPATAPDVWRAMLADPRLTVYVAGAHGLLVSTCTLVIVPNLTHGCRPWAVIENVVTDPAHRRRGYARAVLAHACAAAWAAGCYKVTLTTASDSTAAGFYAVAGFSPGAKRAWIAYPPDVQAHEI